MRHKPLREQVIVITGASSGIGLATARMAAERGARVVLAARSGDVLARSPAEIEAAAARPLTSSPTSAAAPTSRRSPTRPSRASAASTPG